MALVWDSAKRRYRRDGRLLTQRQMARLRDDLADEYASRFAALVDRYVDGDIQRARFERDVLRLVGEAMTAGYTFGRGGAASMTDDDDVLATLIAEQETFARHFLADIQAAVEDGLRPATEQQFIALPIGAIVEGVKATIRMVLQALRLQMRARAVQYGSTVVQAYERARLIAHSTTDTDGRRALPPDPPAMPGDGSSICKANDKCHWETAETATTWELTWTLEPGADHCRTCLDRAATWNPLTLPKVFV